jgi:hypothetical protein
MGHARSMNFFVALFTDPIWSAEPISGHEMMTSHVDRRSSSTMPIADCFDEIP